MTLDQLASRTVADRHAADRYWQERATSQITFARDLGREHPTEAADAAQLATAAEAAYAAALTAGTTLATACAQVEQTLQPLAALAKSHVIHCVGHAHIDMNWMWGWHETVAVTGDTVRTVLQLLAEFPDFHFSQSQASIYRILERHHPDLLAALKPHIASGRWEVTASHWVEGDRNCGSGEAMTRQLLQTRAYFRDLLGLTPEDVTVDWVPDCFGHAATIPAFDARGGVRHYYCWRTGATDRPPAFRWQSEDSSEILVQRELESYNGMPNPGLVRHLWTMHRLCGLRAWMMVYGIGDHGGGPTRRHIRRIIDMDAWPIFPRWRFARSSEWFAQLETVRERLPLWTTELNSEYSGCLVSQAAIKRNNRQMENALAETDGVLALAQRLVAHPVPQPRMDEAWRTCLFGHFHDILPGSGVRATREYSGAQCQEVLAETMALSGGAWRALTAAIDTSFVGAPPQPSALVPVRSPPAPSAAIQSAAFRSVWWRSIPPPMRAPRCCRSACGKAN
jgi:alpha-mannosidase